MVLVVVRVKSCTENERVNHVCGGTVSVCFQTFELRPIKKYIYKYKYQIALNPRHATQHCAALRQSVITRIQRFLKFGPKLNRKFSRRIFVRVRSLYLINFQKLHKAYINFGFYSGIENTRRFRRFSLSYRHYLWIAFLSPF